jgi:hypothetical protein
MSSYIGLLLLLAALALSPVALGYWRKRVAEQELGHPASPVQRAREKEPVRQRTEFRAASVQPCPNACAAALRAAGKRVLLEEVPRLPLDTCDRIQECSCLYEQHADRRSGEDRREQYGSLGTGGKIGQDIINMRSGLDRRSNVDDDLDNLEFE